MKRFIWIDVLLIKRPRESKREREKQGLGMYGTYILNQNFNSIRISVVLYDKTKIRGKYQPY